MAEIIHSKYEVIKKLGSGGGGIVYLVKDLDLDKEIVLKADKRKITTRSELLRREVDIMKNLSHTYIPQVYNFFIEKDTVYTAIDYISGESLDKPLKRGEKFSQPQVIRWARQLLEALDYLHSPTHGNPPKGYVHSDIKPANIMRTPDNNICLIDFNIALALGEENAVGKSFGYSSPEHYGIDYSGSSNNSNLETVTDSKQSEVEGKSKINKTEISPKPSAGQTLIESSDSVDMDLALPQANKAKTSTDKTELNDEKIVDDETHIDLTTIEDKVNDDTLSVLVSNRPLLQENIQETVVDSEVSKSKNLTKSDGNSVVKKTVHQDASRKTSSSVKKIMPDVRSDIYMVGATLYHLLSGNRPAKDALEVVPLSYDGASSLIVDIIKKAMNPNPDLRFQSASEMLDAFNNLHDNDPEMIRFKKRNRISLCALLMFLVIGIFSSFVGMKRIQVVDRWKSLCGYSRDALNRGDRDAALNYALQAVSTESGIFTPKTIPEAQLALTDALNIYDLSEGFKNHKVVELPSNPLYMVISPDGATAACVYSGFVAIFNTDTAEIIASLPADKSALSEVEYLDNDVIIYAGVGGICAYNIKNDSELWKGSLCTGISISQDGKYVAAVYKDEEVATIYSTASGEEINKIDFNGRHQRVTINDSFANPNDNLFEISPDGTFLGVSFEDGSLEIYDLTGSDDDIEVFDSSSGYTHYEGGFYERYLAFSASNKSESIYAVIDTVEKKPTGIADSQKYFGVKTDKTGIYLQSENLLVKIDPVTREQTPVAKTEGSIFRFATSDSHAIVTTKESVKFFDFESTNLISNFEDSGTGDFVQVANGVALIGSIDTQKIKILKYDSPYDAEVLMYEPSYEHDELRVSADMKTAMLFNYKCFRICDMSGKIIKDVELPNPEQVYDQQFIRDDQKSTLEVTYNDGTVLIYSARDGSLITDERIEKPDLSLHEVFYTDSFRIESPLHGYPTVYNKKTNELVKELSEDGSLTYVTQVGDYTITQYVIDDNYCYGILLNDKCEKLATLPYLCDVYDGNLYFDYPTGKMRVSCIYSLDELIEMARNELKGGN